MLDELTRYQLYAYLDQIPVVERMLSRTDTTESGELTDDEIIEEAKKYGVKPPKRS